MLTWIQRLNLYFDDWITSPAPHAAERMGLYRILFGVYYLWIQSNYAYDQLGKIPIGEWQPIMLLSWVQTRPSSTFFLLAEGLLVASVIFLIFGYKTRYATILVFILGSLLDAFRLSYGKVSHESTFMTFYIPLLMCFSYWGDKYSLDAVLGRSKKSNISASTRPSWFYIWPARVVLILLSFLFLTDFAAKSYGVWLSDFEIVPKITLMHNILGIQSRGYVGNIQSIFVASTPPIYLSLHLASFLFQGLFWLSLFHYRLRHLFVANAILFHSYNVFVMNIHFNAVLLAYFIFVDWQLVLDYLRLNALKIPTKSLTNVNLVVITVLTAAVMAFSWNGYIRNFLQAITNEFTIWYLVAPVAFIWFIYTAFALVFDMRIRIKEMWLTAWG